MLLLFFSLELKSRLNSIVNEVENNYEEKLVACMRRAPR